VCVLCDDRDAAALWQPDQHAKPPPLHAPEPAYQESVRLSRHGVLDLHRGPCHLRPLLQLHHQYVPHPRRVLVHPAPVRRVHDLC